MKTTKIFCAALAMAALALSCTREAELPDSMTGGIEMEFTAAWAEADGSRTILREDGASIWWSAYEEINVFIGEDVSAKFVSTNSKPQAIASFVGNVLIGYPETSGSFPGYWAVYPYDEDNSCDGESVSLKVSEDQVAVAGSFADKFFPAVARSANFMLAFWNVCGGARFSVVTEGVQKVVFRSNDGSPMAGTVQLGFGDDDKPLVLEITEAKDSVVVNAPEGGFVPGTNYFAAMLPQTHEQGLAVTLYTDSKKAVKAIDKSITVHRSAFGKLDNVDEGLVYKRYKYAIPEMVDLGLSVKWASFNVGASAPEEYGDYFAWGETLPKAEYSWSTYKWCNGSKNTLTKYCTNSSYGYNGCTDNRTVLEPDDDAACVLLGGSWRVPTVNEITELYKQCTWEWTTLNGVNGRKFTSNKEGYTNKWIFLPAAGRRIGTSLNGVGSYGYYWSSSLYTDNPGYAQRVDFDSDVWYWGYNDRYLGQSVRAVNGDLIHATGVSVSPESATVNVGETLQLTETISPANAFEKGLTWSSSDGSVATVSADGLVSGLAAGTADITVTTVDGGFTASCAVTVVKLPVPEAVDLGLSVKWASFNLGASAPEEYGDYFAWGETLTKAEYSWSTYKWCNGSKNTLTKYCTNSSYGYNGCTDNRTVLEPDDDAACVLLGGSWRVPTVNEIIELYTQCTWEWTTLNGVNGRKFTSNKEGYTNKWIFLPAAGCRIGTSLNGVGSYGYYWSSSLYTDNPSYAYYLYFNSGSVRRGSTNRYYGQSVRPVSE